MLKPPLLRAMVQTCPRDLATPSVPLLLHSNPSSAALSCVSVASHCATPVQALVQAWQPAKTSLEQPLSQALLGDLTVSPRLQKQVCSSRKNTTGSGMRSSLQLMGQNFESTLFWQKTEDSTPEGRSTPESASSPASSSSGESLPLATALPSTNTLPEASRWLPNTSWVTQLQEEQFDEAFSLFLSEHVVSVLLGESHNVTSSCLARHRLLPGTGGTLIKERVAGSPGMIDG